MRRSSLVKTDRVWNIFRYTLGRFRGILLFYGILLLLLGPVSTLVQYGSGVKAAAALPELFVWGIPLVMAVLMPLLIFGFVNHKQALDVFHAAPIRRDTLYLGSYLAGLFLVEAPLFLFGGMTAFLQQVCFQSGEQGLLCLLNFGISAFMSFSLMVFVLINCGTMFESVVYYVVLCAGWPALIQTMFRLLQQHTYGYRQTADSLRDLLFSACPYYLLTKSGSWEGFQPAAAAVPVLMGVLLAIGGCLLYRRRKSESAGQSFAYRPVFFIGAVLTSLSVGMEFLVLSREESPIGGGTVLLACLIGALAYAILDTVRNRGFKRIRRTLITAMAVVCGAAGIGYLGAVTGTFGYEDRLPELSQVENVRVETASSLSNDSVSQFNEFLEVTLKDPESIKLVLDFHQAMIAEKKPIREYQNKETKRFVSLDRTGVRVLNLIDGYDRYQFDDGRYAQSDYGNGADVTLIYQLRNGRVMARQYRRYPFVLTKPLYRLLQTEEFREEMNGKILDSLPEQGGILELSSACFSGYSRVEVDEVQMEPLREAVRKDLGDRPADFLVSPEAFPLYMVSMRVWQPEQGYWHYATDSFYLYESDRRTLALLKEWEALPQLRTEFFEGTVVGYIPLEKRDAVMNYPERDGGIFYQSGRLALYTEYSQSYLEPSEEGRCYEPKFVTVTAEQYLKLMQMIGQRRFSEEGADVVVLNSTCYLVKPEYAEAVREMLLSAPEYEPEY